MSDLIPIPPLPAPPAIQLFANGELAHVNSALQRRIDEHKARFGAFWRTYDYTPDDILINFGSNSLVWLQAASESVDHINRLAAIVGKTIADYMDSSDYAPPRDFLVSEAGVVTLAPPADGYDAWGRLIPVPPEPTPEPEPEPTPEPEPEPEPEPTV
jgi:hypothetical protein